MAPGRHLEILGGLRTLGNMETVGSVGTLRVIWAILGDVCGREVTGSRWHRGTLGTHGGECHPLVPSSLPPRQSADAQRSH